MTAAAAADNFRAPASRRSRSSSGAFARAGAVNAPPLEVVPVDCSGLHGCGAAAAHANWPNPKCVAASSDLARPGYAVTLAHEFEDSPTVLRDKVRILAAMLRSATAPCLYTGAGLSVAAGIRDYASKASGSVALKHCSADGQTRNRLELSPTVAHHALAALERAGHVAHWVQQNHDGLAQKAGFPHRKLNEIHGSWFDPRHNPVVLMDGQLRADLVAWMMHWAATNDLVIAIGTSLTTRMCADVVPATAARRYAASTGTAAPHHGLVIINLQRTALDDVAALRINGRADVVLSMLAAELSVAVTTAHAVDTRGAYWSPTEAAAHRALLKRAVKGTAAFP